MPLIEGHRDRCGLPFIDTTRQDLRFAYRTLRKHPAFTTVVVLTLSVGIAAATSMFTVVRAVLLRPLPYANPERLIEISETNPLKGWIHTVAAPANIADWRARNTVFTDIAAYNGVDERGASQMERVLTMDGEPQPVSGIAVTGNLFDVLGVKPLVGRGFSWDETFDGRDRLLVLAYGTWQSVFGGDPHIVGRTVTMSGRTMTVVGVMPREFFFPNATAQFWTPLGIPPDALVTIRRPHYLNTVARLRPGVSLAQARDQMRTIAAELERAYPDTNTKMGVRLDPLHAIMAADARDSVLILFGAVAVLFLIVCANIASLQLGRGASRLREITLRRALGAARGRLIRQLLTEAFVLSAAGTTLGLALAALTPALLVRAAPSALPLFAAPKTDATVLLFAAALGLTAPFVFGLAPALSTSMGHRLVERVESSAPQTTAARDLLVALEVALSVVLVAGAMLLIRSLLQLHQVDPGFRPDHTVSFKVALPRVDYPKGADQARAFDDIEQRLRALPGVDAVGLTSTLALRGYTWTGDATVEGRGIDDYERELRHESVTPGYFQAMRSRLVSGRMLTEHDGADPRVTLVNESLAKQYFRGTPAVGKRINFGRPTDADPWTTIVGVVADEKQDGMDKPVRPEVYVPYVANPQNPATFVVRSPRDPESIAADARQIARTVNRNLVLSDITTLTDLVSSAMGDQRFRTTLLSGFAGVAVFLAALGIYGVLAYFVSQRSRELGIRLALGANRQRLFAMVVRQGMRPVLGGAGIGFAAALALTSTVQTMLFGITPLDPPAFASAIGLLACSAFVACAVPAARATRVDPQVTLRAE